MLAEIWISHEVSSCCSCGCVPAAQHEHNLCQSMPKQRLLRGPGQLLMRLPARLCRPALRGEVVVAAGSAPAPNKCTAGALYTLGLQTGCVHFRGDSHLIVLAVMPLHRGLHRLECKCPPTPRMPCCYLICNPAAGCSVACTRR